MTLLEVLIVMVILGLLATLGGLQLSSYLGRAKTDTARLQIQELSTAIELFRLDCGRPPNGSEGLSALLQKPQGVENWRGPYVKKTQNIYDPWGRPFLYRTPGERGEFDLTSLGADNQVGGDGENLDVRN